MTGLGKPKYVFMYFISLIISKVCDPAGLGDTQPRESYKEGGTFNLTRFKVLAPRKMSSWS